MSDDRLSISNAEEILSGEKREARLLVARGLFPLPTEDLIPLQVQMAISEEPEIAELASESLQQHEPTIIATVIGDSEDSAILEYFADHPAHPVVLESILRHRKSTADVLGRVAPQLSAELQELLLLRQDLIVENPELLVSLEANPDLSSYSSRRIAEYREHLVRKPEKSEASATDFDSLLEDVTDEELEAAISAALELPAEGEKDEATGLSEAQVRSLPIPIRLKLARGAPRTLRSILVRDKNPMVAVAVISGNALGDAEVEQIASNRGVVEEVLDAIARNRQFSRKYAVVLSLVKNPRTSVGLARRLVPRLSPRDLRALSRDRNISEAVRSTADRLYKIKTR